MKESLKLKSKNIISIGSSRGIVIDAAYFDNGQLNPSDVVDVEIRVVGSRGEK